MLQDLRSKGLGLHSICDPLIKRVTCIWMVEKKDPRFEQCLYESLMRYRLQRTPESQTH